jgi:hypothetical protein
VKKLCGMAVLLACSWILWSESTYIGVVGMSGYERSWEIKAAYPDNGHAQCIRDAQTRAERSAANSGPNVKRKEYSRLMGDQHSVHTELKNGGTMTVTYTCLPDTVKP